jgi:4-aminobutyrate aminotransferase/(S)-3-amino-2-methylpropionate transaminase
MPRDSSKPSSQNNAELIARRRAVMPAGVGQTYNVFVDRAVNSEVWDVEGKRYVDFSGGIAVLNTGHQHPKVIAAVKAQLDKVHHTCFQVLAYEPYVELCERLVALAPATSPRRPSC